MRTTPTAFVPAHKQTSEEHKPGQVVTNPLGFVIQPREQTLAEYVNRVKRSDAFDSVAQEKKLTFEEWLRQSSFVEPDAGTFNWLRDCWKAAQENCR